MKKIFFSITLLCIVACNQEDGLTSAELKNELAAAQNSVLYKANDDVINLEKNNTLEIGSLLNNDIVASNSILSKINTVNTTGTATLLSNNKISYTPKINFTGSDSFTYTVCSPNGLKCSEATVKVQVFSALDAEIPTNTGAGSYYANITLLNNGEAVFDALKNLTSTTHTTKLTYFQRHRYLYSVDEDPNNKANVILMYTGESRDEREYSSNSNRHSKQTFNTEHVYPQSKFKGGEIVRADLHHLRTCDEKVNSNRSNRFFIDADGNARRVGGGWYPGDEWRGDVARMILYLNIRYNERIETIANLNTLLKWNAEDPVSKFEEQRNNRIANVQGNRNPFIDNPFLATLIWGGPNAENKWTSSKTN